MVEGTSPTYMGSEVPVNLPVVLFSQFVLMGWAEVSYALAPTKQSCKYLP